MTTIDKAALIEQAEKAIGSAIDSGHLPDRWPIKQAARVTLPVIAKALLAPLRELHTEIVVNGSRCCDNCDGNGYPCPTVRLLDAIEGELQ